MLGIELTPKVEKMGKPPIVKKLDMKAALVYKKKKEKNGESPLKSIKDSPLPSFDDELISPISRVSPPLCRFKSPQKPLTIIPKKTKPFFKSRSAPKLHHD